MNGTFVKTSLPGLMQSTKKSTYPLAPVYEAITNALEAILQKHYIVEHPEITVTFAFNGLIEKDASFASVSIQDNGIGFNDDNFKRFETVFDKSKGYNNRGSGRLQYLHRFEKIEFESYFQENDSFFKRVFTCNSNNFIIGHSCKPISENNQSTGTTVTLLGHNCLKKDIDCYNRLSLHEIAQNLKKHFLLRYYLEAGKSPVINIVFNHNGSKRDCLTIKPDQMPKPKKVGSVTLNYVRYAKSDAENFSWRNVPDKTETMKWAHFELPDIENAICLCSKGVTVTSLPFDGLRKKENVDGKGYLTAFYGDVFDNDNNVNHSVDSFSFPDRHTIEESIVQGDFYRQDEEFMFIDDIKQAISDQIPEIYRDIFDVQEKQRLAIEEIAHQHAISPEVVAKARAYIRLNDTQDSIIKKLYRAQSEEQSRNNKRITEIFHDLKNLNPVDTNYQDALEKQSKKLLELIPLQNKEELGRYVIRREMVAEVLRKILAQELAQQQISATQGARKDKEGLIHDLIFKRRSKNFSNDLWILSEEYIHFDGCSEIALNKITDSSGQKLLRYVSDDELKKHGVSIDKRPDIFLYASERKCVLIELKAPDVDLSAHLNQMIKYCNVIANYAEQKIQNFYLARILIRMT